MLFLVLFAFCYQAYALSVKRWGGGGERRTCYRQRGLWLFCAPGVGVESLLKAMFLSPWFGNTGLACIARMVEWPHYLASCYFPGVLTQTPG